MVHVEIILGTLVDQLFARTITSSVAFYLLNESKGVWVMVNVLAPPNWWPLYVLLVIWIFPKNTFGMCKIIAICTIIEPMLWVAFFFTNITIIFTRVIFNIIKESKVVLILFVLCGLW